MKLLTLNEAFQLTNISIWTLKAAIKTGKLRAAKLGRSFYITQEALEKYVKSQTVEVK